MLREKFFVDTLELFFNPLDLLPRRLALLSIQFPSLRAGQPALSAVHDGDDHLQIADQLGGRPGRSWLLPLCFEKQRRVFQDALADGGRSSPPGGIQLPRFAAVAVMRGKDGCHPLAVLQTLPRHRHQKLHRHLRRNFALAHLLLDGLR